jgi:L-ascorbate metabolism protein UlaG (beta-lactamase superfamily)
MDHFDGRRFFNPHGANGQSFRQVPKLLRTKRTAWPASVPVHQQRPPSPVGGEAVVTFIGHATFLIQSGDVTVITDPVYSQRASPVQFAGPKRVRQPGVRFDDLPPITTVLLSHNHYDHCDLAALRAIEQRDHPQFITPLRNGALLRRAGAQRITELDWWQETALPSLHVTCTPAQHFSARTPFDRNRMLWAGFYLRLGTHRIYFVGDSGYAPHFSDIHRRLGAPDLSCIPIGAYEPRWFMKDIHMDPAEAVQVHADLGSRQSVAMHFGTFQLTPEGINEPPRQLAEVLEARNIAASAFRVLEAGASVRLPAAEEQAK